jgi:uncharacterized RDD family membrane protein YckC
MSELSINTTQNVNINFTAATVGERISASVLDLLIKIAYCIVVYGIFFYAIGIDKYLDSLDGWAFGAVITVFFFPVMIYSITLESLFEGQSFGKKIIGTKVVKIDGYQASFGDYLIRWIFRLIEGYWIFAGIGLVAISSSKKTQRLGDMAAGTAIITLKNKISINSTILEEIGNEYVPTYAAVIKLSDNDMRIIKDTFILAKSKNDKETIRKLTLKIEQVCEIKNQSGNDQDFLKTVLKDYNFYTRNM